MKTIILIFFSFLFVISSAPVFASELAIDPNIETVSTGPFWNIDVESRVRFRLVTFLSEVYYSVYIEKIEYGDENCCTKVVKTYEINLKKLGIKYHLYSVEDIQWLNYNTVQFTSSETTYTIKNLDGEYEVVKSP